MPFRGNWFLNVKWSYSWSFNDLFSWKLAHAFVTGRTNRAKAGGKGVKSIAYWCLRWRTELSDSRDQELGWQGHTKYRLPVPCSNKYPPTDALCPSHLCGYLTASSTIPLVPCITTQLGGYEYQKFCPTPRSIFWSCAWDKLYLPKETMIYNCKLYSWPKN